MRVRVVDRPVLDWSAVVRAARPTAEPSRARLRTLRAHGLAGDGVHVRGGHPAGSHTYYLAGTAYVARLARRGDYMRAQELARAVAGMEKSWQVRLRRFLQDSPLSELPAAPWYQELVEESRTLLERFGASDLTLLSGLVDQTLPTVRVTGQTPEGTAASVDLPPELVTGLGLSVGDPVVVLQQHPAPGTVVLEVVPGTVSPWPDDEDVPVVGHEEILGRPMSDEAVAHLKRRLQSGTLPVRTLRPAG